MPGAGFLGLVRRQLCEPFTEAEQLLQAVLHVPVLNARTWSGLRAWLSCRPPGLRICPDGCHARKIMRLLWRSWCSPTPDRAADAALDLPDQALLLFGFLTKS